MPPTEKPTLPLAGLRVVEFTHMVMGPTCGMILADLGAEVIKVEPLAGDSTRTLLGSGAGFFSMFNRDWSSDVCSSDLFRPATRPGVVLAPPSSGPGRHRWARPSLRRRTPGLP